jgi:hypothetical protein
MLHSLNSLLGTRLAGVDGVVGTILDAYLDDADWLMHHLVVDRAEAAGKRILAPAAAVTGVDLVAGVVFTGLDGAAIAACPDWDEHQPVSRRAESELAGYTACSLGMALMPGLAPALPAMPPSVFKQVSTHHESADQSCLRSCRELGTYRVIAADGVLGDVADLVFDDRHSRVCLVAVRNGEAAFIIPTDRISQVSWYGRSLTTDLLRLNTAHLPHYDPSQHDAASAAASGAYQAADHLAND